MPIARLLRIHDWGTVGRIVDHLAAERLRGLVMIGVGTATRDVRAGERNHENSGEDAHLAVQSLTTGYKGGPPVLQGVSLEVRRGEILAVLGRNGVGKTTLLRAISGLLPWRQGAFRLDGVTIRGQAAYQVARSGVGHVPEGRRVIPSMTVLDNLRVGGYVLGNRRNLEGAIAETLDLFPGLSNWRDRVAATLSGGEQQMLSVARALMARPTAVMLDEPLTGLSPVFRRQVLDALLKMRELGKAILLVEQNVVETLDTADRVTVLEGGRVAFEDVADGIEVDTVKQYIGLTV